MSKSTSWLYSQNTSQILLILTIPTTSLLIRAPDICYLDHWSSLLTIALLSLCWGVERQHRTVLILCGGWKYGKIIFQRPCCRVPGCSCPFPITTFLFLLIVQLIPSCTVLLDTRSQLRVVFFVASDTCWGYLFTYVLSYLLFVSFLEYKLHARGTWFTVVRAVSRSVSCLQKLLELLPDECVNEEGWWRAGPWAPILHGPWPEFHRVDVVGGGRGMKFLGKPGHMGPCYSSLCHLRKDISSLQTSSSPF